MRRLHVVGLADDDETVILEDPIRHERFTVPGDERLRAAARGDVRRLGQIEIDTSAPLRPRDIQARIRAGESVEQVAAHGGVTRAHVERFAYPVLLERARVAGLAGHARPRQDAGEPRTLREIVTSTLAVRGQDHDEPSWDAWKGEGGDWIVGLAWRAGRTDNLAHWTYRPGPSGGVIAARDDPARELLGEAPVGGPRRVGESAEATPPEAAPPEPARPEPARSDVAPSEPAELDDELPSAATASGEVAPRSGARGSAQAAQASSAAATRRTGNRSGTRTGDTRRARTGRSVPDQRAPEAGGAASPAASPATRRRTADPGSAADATPSDDADSRGRSRRHPIVPSWEDVLLGVRSPRE